jgi:hypothetical protein
MVTPKGSEPLRGLGFGHSFALEGEAVLNLRAGMDQDTNGSKKPLVRKARVMRLAFTLAY